VADEASDESDERNCGRKRRRRRRKEKEWEKKKPLERREEE
jgi:hypothetical protein